ncbi:glycine cleavage system aminomethyltransferase GcvT [Cobetia amphilecti]|nr:glycine cleavage system aminomethyltransferase GcvT [Cobetia amphilecti]MDO6816553.1 glycine cleavage system aminomethyltransferase GcvT [Cobetia amphilecti]
MTGLKQTALHDLHVEQGARMVEFAGYSMPVQYPLGVKKEHEHTRAKAGLFDVSHMGQLILRGENVQAALEALVPTDIIDLPVGMQRYGLLTSDTGGILDDLMIVNGGDHLYVVVNAACKDQDIAHLRVGLPMDIELEVLDDRALLALQGPMAHAVMQRLSSEACELTFMHHAHVTIEGIECWVSRSGYTGEDGFEISVPDADAERFARLLLAMEEVEFIGLGARDSLRLEAGLCLYGHDLDTTTSPVEGSLIWALGKVRRQGGEREGGFPGADVILTQIANKDHTRKRVGLVAHGRAPIREGAELYDAQDNRIGVVTSGSFGPTYGKPVAMGYVGIAHSALETEVFADVRGKRLPMTVTKMPFVEQRYYRG